MVNCPRCDQPVDETVRTTCPLCFTPLRPEADAAQPQPTAPPLYQPAASASAAPVQPAAMPLNAPAAPLRGPNTRVTLNGDIIDATPTPAAAPLGGGSYAPRPAAPRPNYATPARVETRSRSGRGAVVAIVVVLLLLGGGFGGYYWWMHRTNPKDTATKFMTAVKAQDWKAVYELSDLDDQAKSKYTSAQDFADKTKAQLNALPGIGQFINTILSGLKFEVQDPKDNDGSTATVPINISVTVLGRDINQTQDMKLKNVGGIWKVSGGNGTPGLGGFGGMGGGLSGGMRGFGTR